MIKEKFIGCTRILYNICTCDVSFKMYMQRRRKSIVRGSFPVLRQRGSSPAAGGMGPIRRCKKNV